jgi:hypothetical protein
MGRGVQYGYPFLLHATHKSSRPSKLKVREVKSWKLQKVKEKK